MKQCRKRILEKVDDLDDEQMFAGGVLLLTLLLGLCLCGIALADGSAADADQLKALIEQGGTITLSNNLSLAEPLMVNADTVLELSNHTLTFSGLTKDGSAIQVAQGKSLTLKNGTLTTSDNEGRAILADKGGSTVVLEKMTIQNFHTNGNGGAVLMDGSTQTATLTAKSTKFGGWNSEEVDTFLSAEDGGAVYAENTVITINGCMFYMIQATRANSSTAWYGGGGLYLSGAKSSGIINNTYFYYCRSANNGAAVHLDAVGGSVVVKNNRMMYGESSLDGKAYGADGGGIYVRICKDVTISNNLISYNDVWGNGAGVMVLGDEKTNVVLRGNTISDNWAKNRGGGIKLVLVSGANVQLESGIIRDNSAGVFGGGIDYTTHDMPTLKLKNVFISGNTASRGAGIWCCPTSETEMYSTVGGVIFGNTASGSVAQGIGKPRLEATGDDVRYEGQDTPDLFAIQENKPSETTRISVTNRAFNGSPITWYSDEAEDRYETGDEPIQLADYQNRNTSFGLHGVMAEDLAAVLRNEAALIITGNSSNGRGGGIATNSPIQIGEANADVQVTVRKVWTEKEHPTSVKVDLYRVDADGIKVKLDRDVELNAENEWQAVFANLPAYTLTKNGEQAPYTYEVKEQPVDGWITAAEITTEDDGRSILVTLTNSPEPTATPPKTGDASTPALWLVLTALSVAAMLTLALRRRRA